MGQRNQDQGQLFYEFRLDEAIPDDHLVRTIRALLDLSWVYAELAPYYSEIGRPSIDPVLMVRMLIVGYVFAIRSERQICREVQVNLAYRWFCDLGLEDAVPDHSAFSRARNERFRESDIFRRVFERVVGSCIEAGLVGGEGTLVFFGLRAVLVDYGAWYLITLGGVAVIVMLAAPEGLWGLVSRRLDVHFFPVHRRLRVLDEDGHAAGPGEFG